MVGDGVGGEIVHTDDHGVFRELFVEAFRG